MGFSYRKSFSAGPFRVNLGKSGVGYSIDDKGFRDGAIERWLNTGDDVGVKRRRFHAHP